MNSIQVCSCGSIKTAAFVDPQNNLEEELARTCLEALWKIFSNLQESLKNWLWIEKSIERQTIGMINSLRDFIRILRNPSRPPPLYLFPSNYKSHRITVLNTLESWISHYPHNGSYAKAYSNIQSIPLQCGSTTLSHRKKDNIYIYKGKGKRKRNAYKLNNE